MEQLFGPEFLKELPVLKFAGRAAEGAAQAGMRKSRAKGSSVEFSDFREYLPGDDVRRLDWNAYARLGKLYMKLYMEEREGIFSLYVDLSPSMSYGMEPKARQALRMAAVLSYMALQNQDRVKICLAGIADQTALPLRQSFHGSAAFSKVLAYLQAAEEYRQEAIEKKQDEKKKGDIKVWEVLHRLPPDLGGNTILLSDFMPEDITEEVKYLRLFRKQTVLLFQVLAEEELHPDFVGTNQLLDMENNGQMRITLTAGLARAYQKELAGLRQKLQRLAERYQCHYQQVSTKEPATAFLRLGMNRYWQHR